MQKYELMFILRVDMTDADRDAALKNLKDSIVKMGGEVSKEDSWGKKRLAYPIKSLNEGYYFVWNISLPGAQVSILTKNMSLSPEMIRAQIILEKEV